MALIGGGSGSGKSRFALDYAQKRFRRPAFVATAQALDSEMAERIERHRAQRGPEWITIEEPLEVAASISREQNRSDGFLVDCLTLWLSNLLESGSAAPERAIARLIEDLSAGPPVILVTNEVGCGLVPDNALARRFRDLAGLLNQQAAAAAGEVYWVAFGVPVQVKR